MSTIKTTPGQTWHKHFHEDFGEYVHGHLGGSIDHKHGEGGNQEYRGVVSEPSASKSASKSS